MPLFGIQSVKPSGHRHACTCTCGLYVTHRHAAYMTFNVEAGSSMCRPLCVVSVTVAYLFDGENALPSLLSSAN